MANYTPSSLCKLLPRSALAMAVRGAARLVEPGLGALASAAAGAVEFAGASIPQGGPLIARFSWVGGVGDSAGCGARRLRCRGGCCRGRLLVGRRQRLFANDKMSNPVL